MRLTSARLKTPARTIAALTALLAAASGCTGGGGSDEPSNELTVPNISAPRQLGAGEGSLNLLAWAGYVENGSTDKKADWVTPFVKATQCMVNVTVPKTADEMYKLMRSGQYDAASVPGEISLKLITTGAVAPLNTALVPNYADIVDGLKGKAWNSVGGQSYGVPHGRAAQVLLWRTDVVKTDPSSWASVFGDATAAYQGKLTAPDSPMYLADAAVYLMATQPGLGIKDPYALDDKQFKAVVDLVTKQRAAIGGFYPDYTAQLKGYRSGASVLGPSGQAAAALAKLEGTPVKSAVPSEGTTGSSDTWMISARSKHRNCAYRWLDHIADPKVNAQISEWVGQAPANRKSCAVTEDKSFCAAYSATDESFYSKVYMHRTPVKECLDGRPGRCKDYQDWTKAWAKIKG
ncbi:MAG: putative spermidine/putrescine transport system substrate-binding protein [Cryptosporangiaceae bacterium]|jgi:putative spermidine/putrescine transport system substrate-binding protein|nr:putative spermidine/putrescine transport system substrate-binding protein [Cryptosporangiaceae bacterium]